jgi:hypothetical protein
VLLIPADAARPRPNGRATMRMRADRAGMGIAITDDLMSSQAGALAPRPASW